MSAPRKYLKDKEVKLKTRRYAGNEATMADIEKCSDEVKMMIKILFKNRVTAHVKEVMIFSRQYQEAVGHPQIKREITRQRHIAGMRAMDKEGIKLEKEKMAKSAKARVYRRLTRAVPGEIIHYTFLGSRAEHALVKMNITSQLLTLENEKVINFDSVIRVSGKPKVKTETENNADEVK